MRFADGAGLGDMGGRFPSEAPGTMDWKWATPGQPTPHTPAGGPPSAQGWRTWLGDVDAGLYLKLKGTDKSWNRGNGADDPSTAAWSNGGKGGVTFEVVAGRDQGDDMNGTSSGNGHGNGGGGGSGSGSGTVRVTAFTSALTLHRGTSITFNVTILATPVKGDYQHTPEGKREHYKTFRHWHVPYGQWDPPSGSAIYDATGANTVILHQSNRLNPYIDWPFHPTVMPSLKEYVDEHLYSSIIFSVAKYLHFEMKSYTLRPDIFTLNFNVTLSGTLTKPKAQQHRGTVQTPRVLIPRASSSTTRLGKSLTMLWSCLRWRGSTVRYVLPPITTY